MPANEQPSRNLYLGIRTCSKRAASKILGRRTSILRQSGRVCAWSGHTWCFDSRGGCHTVREVSSRQWATRNRRLSPADGSDRPLFRFFEYHNTCIGLFDPGLHTPAYTYSTSTLLFHAILAVSASTFHAECYVELWQRTRSMLNMAFAAAEESIELCQAATLVFLWNDPEDRTGSLRFGFAVR